MTNINPNALLRSLIIYAICIPLSILVGYTAVNLGQYNLNDMQSWILIAVLAGLIVFPLLMKWHYQLLVLSCSLPFTMFFLPGRPSLYLLMAVVSLSISAIERILSRNRQFLPAGNVKWALVTMFAVVYMTAKLTGGIGLRSMGSDAYGGKKYVFLIIGILAFFAFVARPIPRNQANYYLTLFFIGGVVNAMTDLYPWVPSFLHFIYAVIPASGASFGGESVEFGTSRMGGIAQSGGAIFGLMLARYGIRGIFMSGKMWRPVLLLAMLALVMLGGFRLSIIVLCMTMAMLFYMEKAYQTHLLPMGVFAGLVGAALLIPMAPHLPTTFQRALAFLPLEISPTARAEAQASSDWRLAMWQALLPQVPKYLLLGKGYSFSADDFNNYMGANATFTHTIDASQDPLALSSDFHSGPLSVLIPFGIWGVMAWLWFCAAGFWVVWRNYRYGDPEIKHINNYFMVGFIVKMFVFFFIFGAMQDDVGSTASLLGMSVAFNHGIRGPRPVPKTNPVFGNPQMALPPRPGLQSGPYQWSQGNRRETQTAHS